MPLGKELPDPQALAALGRLREHFERTLSELHALLELPGLPPRFAAAATIDLLERLREWQQFSGPPPLNPSVTGIEITQGIQYFRPPVNISAATGRTGIQSENDLPLVARKTTILRVYLQDIENGSGIVEWRPTGTALWSPPLSSLAPVATALSDPVASRASISGTLNFRLPAAECVGNLEVRLTFTGTTHPRGERVIWDLQGHAHYQGGTGTHWTATDIVQLTFVAVNPLGVRLVRMRYEGRGKMLAAPTVGDFWSTSVQLRRMYPLSDICLWRESEVLYDGDFSDITPGAQHAPGTPNGGTTGDWLHIMNNMIALENAPSAVRYVMLYPNGALGASSFLGWGINRTALTPVNNQSALAHEVGHVCGRPHAPCGGPAAPDPWYPTYGSYPPASIGEFGIDIATLAIMDPATYKDFMSYCGPTWISPYQYEHIRNWLLIYPGPTTCIQPSPTPVTRDGHEVLLDRLALTLQIYRTGRVGVSQPSFHLPMRVGAEEGRKTDYFVELRNQGGDALSSLRLWLQDTNQTLDDALTSYFALIPWNDAAVEIVVLHGSDVLQRFPIEGTAPRISKPQWQDKKSAHVRRLSWQCDAPAVRFAVRYSPNDGASWQAIATWLDQPSCAIDLEALPASNAGVVEIVASAGFRTSRMEVKVGRVSRTARIAQILFPEPKRVVHAGETVVLLGHAIGKDGEAPLGSLEWSSSRDGLLGAGRELIVHTLSVGRHIITLSADDGVGGVTRAMRTISVKV